MDSIICLTSLEVEISLLSVKPRISTEFSSLEWWVVICGLQKLHQLRLIEPNVELDLVLMVLARHLFVNQEDFVKEKMHILVMVVSFLIGH